MHSTGGIVGCCRHDRDRALHASPRREGSAGTHPTFVLRVQKGTAKSSVLDNLQQDIAAKAVDMPVPCTSQDVKTACKRLKHSPGELAEYIGSIPPISYKKLLKKDLDIDTLRCFATALKERVGGDPLWAEASIKALGTVDRFRVLSIMSSDVKAMLGDVEKQIEASNA